MKIYNNIYCARESLEEILTFKDVYLELYKLIKICNVIVELDDEEMQSLIQPTERNIELHSFFKEKSCNLLIHNLIEKLHIKDKKIINTNLAVLGFMIFVWKIMN